MSVFGDYLLPEDPRFADPEEFFPRHYKIRHKAGGRAVQFDLWDHQRVLSQAVMECYRQNKWLLFVKPRKLGSSTFFTGVINQHCMFREYTHAAIVAQKEKVAHGLAATAIMMHKHMPDEIKPKKLAGLKRSLEFPEINSKMFAESAAADDPLRGDTGVQAALLTEVCKWGERADDTFTSILSNIPRENGFVIAESTPLFYGDPLQKQWWRADEPDSNWIKLFLPWTAVTEYSSTVEQIPVGWEPGGDVLGYADQWGLTLGQAHWMATVGLARCNMRLDKFRAEYPINDTDCWLLAGETIFNVAILQKWMQALGDPTGGLIEDGPEYVEYEDPDSEEYKNDRYLISCDPAGSWAESDNFGVEVWNLTQCSQAAEYIGHTTAHSMAKRLAELGHKFNNAIIYVEANGVGEAVLSHLVSSNIDYRNVFHRTDNSYTGSGQLKPGWYSTKQTKAESISYMQELIDDESITIRSPRLLRELISYRGQWDKIKGRRDATGGHYDLAAASCIAAWGWHKEPGAKRRTRVKDKRAADLAAWNKFLRRVEPGAKTNTRWGEHL